MMTDPISDMLTRMRNALKAGHDRVEFPASKIKAAVCKVMKDEGYIKSFKIKTNKTIINYIFSI